MTQYPDKAPMHTGPLSFHKPPQTKVTVEMPTHAAEAIMAAQARGEKISMSCEVPTFTHEELTKDLTENMGLVDSDPKTAADSAAARDMYVLENLALLDSQAVENIIMLYKERCNETISAFDSLMILLTMQLKLEEDRIRDPMHPTILKRLPPPINITDGSAVAYSGPSAAERAAFDAPITLSETAEAFMLKNENGYVVAVRTMQALLETQRRNFTAAGVDSSRSRSHTDRLIIMANGLNPDNARAMMSLEMPARMGMSMASLSAYSKLSRSSPPLPPIVDMPKTGRVYHEKSSVDRFEANTLLARQARGNKKIKGSSSVSAKLKEYRKQQAKKR